MVIDSQAAILYLVLLSHNSILQCHLPGKIPQKAITMAMVRMVAAGMMGKAVPQ
jgi:hypothetical protein